ncbi:MAG: HU family DNA-binding protein [Myxococcota bacterium]
MTKAELIDRVNGSIGSDKMTKKMTEKLIDETFNALKEALLDGGRFSYPGFGTFIKKHRKERKGRNPKSRETIMIQASDTVSFKPAPKFKEQLNS